MSAERAEADLTNLEARASSLEAELADVRAEMERIKIFLELSSRYGVLRAERNSAPTQSTQSKEADKNTISVTGAPLSEATLTQACRGKSIPDAAIALIRLVGHPLSEEEIVDGLRRGGVTFVSDAPVVNLRFALLRKRKETGALKVTKDKLWDLGDADDGHESEASQSGFVQNRNRNEHAERSRLGLLAARERGVKNGRRSKITPEIQGLAEILMAERVPDKEIARQVGVTIPTFHRWCAHGLVTRFMNPAEAEAELRKRGWTDEQIRTKLVHSD